MLVSSGWNGSAELDSTEVVDLKSGKIFSMAPLGRRTSGATGGLLDGLPVICGGYKDNQIHSIAKDQSKFLGQLSVRRLGAACLTIASSDPECVVAEHNTGSSPSSDRQLTKAFGLILGNGVNHVIVSSTNDW